MPLNASLIDGQDSLILAFDGNLDFSVARDVFAAIRWAPGELKTCIIDLSDVDRVFDSGVALLQLLCFRLRELNVRFAIKTGRPNVQEQVMGIGSSASEKSAVPA